MEDQAALDGRISMPFFILYRIMPSLKCLVAVILRTGAFPGTVARDAAMEVNHDHPLGDRTAALDLRGR